MQPSLVYGPEGASAMLLLRWATLPWIPLPGRGEQRLQPVHVDDLCAAVVALLAAPQSPRRLAAVGPHALTLRDYLATLRHGLGLGSPYFLPVPTPLVHASVALAAHLPGSLADSDDLPLTTRWLGGSIALNLLALACWLPVVRLQYHMRDLAGAAATADTALPAAYWRDFRRWVSLGFPALVAFIAVFYLMTVKPT